METFKGVIGKISKKSHHGVEWTIENFFSYPDTRNVYYESEDFYILDLPWRLQISPNGYIHPFSEEDCVGWISLSLCKSFNHATRDHYDAWDDVDKNEFADSVVGSRYTFGLKRADGTIKEVKSTLYCRLGRGDKEFHYPRFLERSVLQQRRSELAPNGSLTLTCAWATDEYFKPSTNLNTLSQNLADLFTSKKGCDAILKVMGVEFPVHKLILSARSPVFDAMFEVDMREKRTGLVEIEDCDPEAFGEFLMYLYSGRVKEDSEKLSHLCQIADKYDTPDLKSYCFRIVMSNLSVNNLLDAVMLGRKYNNIGMELKTRQFFKEHFQDISSSTQWAEFRSENANVAFELLEQAASNANERGIRYDRRLRAFTSLFYEPLI